MKLPFSLLLIGVLAGIPNVGSGQAAAKETPELKALKSRYQTDTAAAINPIKARYIANLEALLRTFTQRGDLAAALAVQQELNAEKDAKSSGGEETHRAVREAMAGTWTWQATDAPDDRSTIDFAKDGTGSHGARNNTKWEVTGARDITITHASKGTAVIHLSADSQSFKGTGYNGKPVQGRRMK